MTNDSKLYRPGVNPTSCALCRFCRLITHNDGPEHQCRFDAPTRNAVTGLREWPVVLPSDWCGRWQEDPHRVRQYFQEMKEWRDEQA